MKFLVFAGFLLLCPPLQAQAVTTLGIRQNNPGNIRSTNWRIWPGAVGVDSEGHLHFKRPVDGIRAIVINLKIYRDKHGIRTIQGIASRWLKGEHPQEHIDRYARIMAFRSGLPVRGRLNLHDAGTLKAVTRAIIWAENSQDPYQAVYRVVFPRLKEIPEK